MTDDLEERQEKLSDDVDSVLDEIDDVLEENADRANRQKGGSDPTFESKVRWPLGVGGPHREALFAVSGATADGLREQQVDARRTSSSSSRVCCGASPGAAVRQGAERPASSGRARGAQTLCGAVERSSPVGVASQCHMDGLATCCKACRRGHPGGEKVTSSATRHDRSRTGRDDRLSNGALCDLFESSCSSCGWLGETVKVQSAAYCASTAIRPSASWEMIPTLFVGLPPAWKDPRGSQHS